MYLQIVIIYKGLKKDNTDFRNKGNIDQGSSVKEHVILNLVPTTVVIYSQTSLSRTRWD